MNLASDDFTNGDRLPDAHSFENGNLSPSLRWTDLPPGTMELALICDDPDAPGMTWVHWVLYGLPPTITGLDEGVPKNPTLPNLGGAVQGKNSAGQTGYDGPRPPRGSNHRYFFKLYALSAPLGLGPGASAKELKNAMKGKILAEKEIIGMYSR